MSFRTSTLLQQSSQPALLLQAVPHLAQVPSSAGPLPVGYFVSCVPSVLVCGLWEPEEALTRQFPPLLDIRAGPCWPIFAAAKGPPPRSGLLGEIEKAPASVNGVKLTPGRGQGSVTQSPSLKELLAGPVLKGCGCCHKQA